MKPGLAVTPPNDETGFDAASWAVLAAAILIFVLGLAHTLYRLSLPSDGWFRSGSEVASAAYVVQTYTFVHHPGAAPTPLKHGDVLVAVNGQPFESILARALALHPQPPPNWAAGRMVRYTVLRQGQIITLDVVLRSESLALTFNLDLGGLSFFFFMALLMLVVFCLRPRNAAARLLLLFFVLLSSTAAPTRVADMFDRAAFWTGLFFNDAIWSWLMLPILIHLCLAFPVRKSFLQRHPRLTLSTIYGLVPGVHVLLVLLLISQPRSFPPIYDLFGVGWFVILMLTMVSSVGHSFLSVRDPVGRAQLRWVAFGLLVGLGGSFAVYQLVVWGFGENDLIGISGSVMFLAFPVSLAVAILRYRLFDIDVIINRTLVYGALTAALGLVYVVSVVVLQTLIRAFSGEQQSELVTVGSTLVIAALFTPLRRRIQQTIDRRFYRRKYDAVRTLAALSVKLRDEVDLSALTAELLVVVEETLQPAHASLWLCVPKPKATTHTSNVSSR